MRCGPAKRPASVCARGLDNAPVPEAPRTAFPVRGVLVRGFSAQGESRFRKVTELEGRARHRVAEYQNPSMSGSEVGRRPSWRLDIPIGSSRPPFHLTSPSPLLLLPVPFIPDICVGLDTRVPWYFESKADVRSAARQILDCAVRECRQYVFQRWHRRNAENRTHATKPRWQLAATNARSRRGGAYHAGKQETSQPGGQMPCLADHYPSEQEPRKDEPHSGVNVALTQ